MFVWSQPVQSTAGCWLIKRWLRKLGNAYCLWCVESRFEKDMRAEGGGHLERGREPEAGGETNDEHALYHM